MTEIAETETKNLLLMKVFFIELVYMLLCIFVASQLSLSCSTRALALGQIVGTANVFVLRWFTTKFLRGTLTVFSVLIFLSKVLLLFLGAFWIAHSSGPEFVYSAVAGFFVFFPVLIAFAS